MEFSFVRKVILLLPATLILSGCGNGWPWGRGPDPNAVKAVEQAEPLVAECRKHFTEDLHGLSVTMDSGPTVMRDGATTMISLEAQPTNPDALHPARYNCTFEDGKLVSNERTS
jgi:hypothetical protein